ncbi:MAG: hypothetical protein ACYS0D_02380 [Planctomycetota bacterium]
MTNPAAIAIALAACCPPGDGQDPFATSAMAPQGVQVYLHVSEAAELRRQFLTRPIVRWADAMVADGALPGAWEHLAAAAGTDGSELFDVSLGRCLTVVARRQEAKAEWAVLTDVEPRRCASIVARLEPRIVGPVARLSVFHMPEFELVLARQGRQLLIGPSMEPALFFEMVPHLTRPPADSLADDEALEEARTLGTGSAGMFVRHRPPMGGWSVAVADVQEGVLTVRHAARFEQPPFTSGITELRWAPPPLAALEARTILAIVEPQKRSGGPLEAFIEVGLVSRVPEENLGVRRITTVSDYDGRLADPPLEGLFPTFARVYEVQDPQCAWAEWDEHLLGVVRQLDTLRPEGARLTLPDAESFPPGEPRHLEVGELARWAFGDIPGVERMTLDWSIVSGPAGHWCVVATSPGHLEEVSEALVSREQDDAGDVGTWTNCGTFDGIRLAAQLRNWREQAGQLVVAGDLNAFRETLQLAAFLAEGVERGRWQLTRPTVSTMRVDAEFRLSPPDSTDVAGEVVGGPSGSQD